MKLRFRGGARRRLEREEDGRKGKGSRQPEANAREVEVGEERGAEQPEANARKERLEGK